MDTQQTRDMKMTLYRASFVGNTATVNWNNGRNGYTTLNTNPFETALTQIKFVLRKEIMDLLLTIK